MNNQKTLIRIVAIFACLWVATATTFAAQMKQSAGGMLSNAQVGCDDNDDNDDKGE
jgi:hypothetical protein